MPTTTTVEGWWWAGGWRERGGGLANVCELPHHITLNEEKRRGISHSLDFHSAQFSTAAATATVFYTP